LIDDTGKSHPLLFLLIAGQSEAQRYSVLDLLTIAGQSEAQRYSVLNLL